MPQAFIGNDLENPQQMTMDAAQNLYVSDWGKSNQVKVFSPSGKFLRSIGSAGVVVAGPYDPKLMHRPKGITIDDRDQLWVAEEDFQPKRVSVWGLDGQLLRTFDGPVTYGGGGNLDPKDKTLFYLDEMTFRLNWTTGESRPSKSTTVRNRVSPNLSQQFRGKSQMHHFKSKAAATRRRAPVRVQIFPSTSQAANISPMPTTPVPRPGRLLRAFGSIGMEWRCQLPHLEGLIYGSCSRVPLSDPASRHPQIGPMRKTRWIYQATHSFGRTSMAMASPSGGGHRSTRE